MRSGKLFRHNVTLQNHRRSHVFQGAPLPRWLFCELYEGLQASSLVYNDCLVWAVAYSLQRRRKEHETHPCQNNDRKCFFAESALCGCVRGVWNVWKGKRLNSNMSGLMWKKQSTVTLPTRVNFLLKCYVLTHFPLLTVRCHYLESRSRDSSSSSTRTSAKCCEEATGFEEHLIPIEAS